MAAPLPANPLSLEPLSPFSRTVGDMVKGPALTIAASATVGDAARRMAEAWVGSLVVLEGERPVGIVTKTDMVRRVVAAGTGHDAPVATIMSGELLTIAPESPLFDALLTMIQHGVGHMVVMEGERLAGVISDGDWPAFQNQHPRALFKEMARAESVEALAALRERAQRLVRDFFGDEGNAAALTQIVTEINDRVARRVIELGLKAAGEPPGPFAWIAMGSEGRSEQTVSTDQDNGIVFADGPTSELTARREWYLGFARGVVQGLATCGFALCKGNTMASNPELCLSLTEWQRLFGRIIAQSDPAAVMQASIYFDFRCLYGERPLVDAMWEGLLARIHHNKGFLRFMVGEGEGFRVMPVNTLGWKVRGLLGLAQPPLDLKREALHPLVRALRALALDCGVSEANSLRRLELAAEQGAVPAELADAARSAYDHVMLLRMRHHFSQQERGEPPHDNFDLRHFNSLQRAFLVEALHTISDLEGHVRDKFGGVVVS